MEKHRGGRGLDGGCEDKEDAFGSACIVSATCMHELLSQMSTPKNGMRSFVDITNVIFEECNEVVCGGQLPKVE